jgi:4-carboxymuconolactone decarboxylase
MSRVPVPKPEEMSEEQKRLAELIAGPRGGRVGGPFGVWINVPDIAEPVVALSERLRQHSKMDQRLLELMVLILTRHWQARYAFNAHKKHALRLGIAPEAIDAIDAGTTPHFERDDERLVYDVFSELSEKRTLGQATYDRAVAAFGRDLVIEMVTTAGLYTMISMVLVAFEVPE